MTKQMKVKCPHCGNEIFVDNLLTDQFKKKAEQASMLRLREREKVINDLRKQLSIALRKVEQGSVQTQGEVQEQEMLSALTGLYPFDQVTQSRKGANAADILQVVRLQNGSECGKIYYESKRTQTWSNEWIDKLKSDNLEVNADILVIVTNALPKEIERYGMLDGVWVTGYKYFKELTLVLRYGLIKLQSIALVNQDRESKQAQLYTYLTSNEFKNVFDAILTGFKNIQDSHYSEKVKTMRLWKEREQIFEKLLANSINLHGSLKGIAGSAVPEASIFELASEN